MGFSQFQSQTGSQALSDSNSAGVAATRRLFQSQTGSQALSDQDKHHGAATHSEVSIPNGKPGPLRLSLMWLWIWIWISFNPKREARPSQTQSLAPMAVVSLSFQSQTGSQALSDAPESRFGRGTNGVSIPNGKPGPLRR